jgi:cytochrome c oxidase assembly protein subunit 15
MRDDGHASTAEARVLRRLASGFTALVAVTFGLIVLGALVRAHEAGLACPDWPLCFGQTIPAMNLEVAFEWSHRVLAGSVALAFATLTGIAAARPEARRRVGGWLVLATLLLLAQILLGALTVWQLLAAWTVTLHLLTGNAFAATLLLIAVRLRGAAEPAPVGSAPRAIVTVTFAVLVLQVALGGLVASTYAGLACPEWPTCNGGAWYPSLSGSVGLHLIHRTTGYLLLGLLLVAALSTRQARRLGRAMGAACLLALAQVVVGIANVLLGLPVEVTGLHSALAAALVLTMAFAVDEAWSRAPTTIR